MLKKYYKYIIIGLFISFLFVYLKGTVERILFNELVPIKIPQEFFRINQWLEDQEKDFKITLLPPQFDARILDWARDRKINDFVTISSGKPTVGPQAPYSKLYFLFFESIVNNVPRLDKFFDVLNSKYFIFRRDLPEDYSENLIKSFENDSDLKELDLEKIDQSLFCKKKVVEEKETEKESGDVNTEKEIEEVEKEVFAIQENNQDCEESRESYLRVFENKNFSDHFWLPKNASLVIGGMEAMDILYSQEDFNPAENALIFANQESGILRKIKDLKLKNIIFNNTDFNDLVFALIEDKYLIGLANLTDAGESEWKKAGTSEPLHGEWHRVVDTLRISNWDFDFGKNLIYTSGSDKIIVPFKIENQEKYVLLIRFFQNNQAGKFKIKINETEKIVDTLNLNNKFSVQDLNMVLSNIGEYKMEIQNISGFNAINLVALIPESKYAQYKDEAQKILSKNPIVYAQKITAEMTIKNLQFELAKSGEYDLALRLKNIKQTGEEKLLQRAGETTLKSIDLNFDHQSYYLELDKNQSITWINLLSKFFEKEQSMAVYQEDKQKNLLFVDDFFVLDSGNLQINPEKNKTDSILVDIFKDPLDKEIDGRLITDIIQAKENQGFYLEYKLSGQNLNGLNARVLFYGSDYDPVHMRTAFQVEYFMDKQYGNKEQKFSHFFGTPTRTSYIKIEFKAPTNFEEESWFELSDFKLFRQEDINFLDAIVLKEKSNLKGESIFQNENKLKYFKLNPTKYVLNFEDLKEPVLLAFAESYDAMWILKDRDILEKGGKIENYFSKRFNSVFQSNFNGQINSLPLYSVINAFYIDPKEMQSNHLILEYEPQNWFEMGIFISLGSLGICVSGFLGYWAIKKIKKNKSLRK